jgi:hypothetical protein
LALHHYDFRRKFSTHYLFPMHTTYPAHHIHLCFINIAVFGGDTNVRSSLYFSYLQPSATWPFTSSAYLLPIEQWDLSPGRCLNVCLRLLCLCCAVWVQVLYWADTLPQQSYHRRMHKMYKPAKAALVCRVIRTDSWYRHCPTQVAVTRRKIRRTSNSVKSVHGQLYMGPN